MIAALLPPYQPNAPTLPIAPLELLSDYIEVLIKESRPQTTGKGPKRRIRVRDIRRGQHLTGKRKSETEMMRETVRRRRRIIYIFQVAIEDVTSEVVSIETRSALNDPGK